VKNRVAKVAKICSACGNAIVNGGALTIVEVSRRREARAHPEFSRALLCEGCADRVVEFLSRRRAQVRRPTPR
jgi:hypothetical protein